MSPRFEPQQGAYTVTVDGHDMNPYRVHIDFIPRDGQTVTMALADTYEGVALVYKGNLNRWLLTLSDGPTHEDAVASGTAVVNVSVSQNGHSTTVYALTVNYSVLATLDDTEVETSG